MVESKALTTLGAGVFVYLLKKSTLLDLERYHLLKARKQIYIYIYICIITSAYYSVQKIAITIRILMKSNYYLPLGQGRLLVTLSEINTQNPQRASIVKRFSFGWYQSR